MGRFVLIVAATCAGLSLHGQARAEAALMVKMVTADPVSESRTFSLTGEIAAHETLNASFPAGGKIAEILVKEGDKVTAAQPLARIEAVQQEQSVRAAEASLATAMANLTKARDDSDRQDALLERGATTRSARDAASDQLRVAQAVVAQAEAELDRARKALTDTMLLAPAAATVTERLAEPGEVVGAAQPVLTLALGDQLDAVFDVPEVLLTNFPENSPPPVRLTRLEGDRTPFNGAVREVSPLVDQRTGTVKTTVRVIDPPPGLSYGDAVIGSVTTAAQKNVALPYAALSATAAGPAVWVIDPASRTVSLRQVQILRYQTDVIVLAGGLEGGDQVVTQGANLLFPGRLVQVGGTP